MLLCHLRSNGMSLGLIDLNFLPIDSNSNSDDSAIFNNGKPPTLLDRFGYVKQLILSKTKLEFRLIWNKIFQKEDDELGWLLNPYKQSTSGYREATMMKTFDNMNDSYQYGYNDVSSTFGRERVTIYNRGIVKKSRARKSKKSTEKKTLTDTAFEIARYMGMGVYMTSTSFPSPFYPINEGNFYNPERTSYDRTQNVYTMSKIW